MSTADMCLCGCGERAPIARRACPRQGVRRGDQLRYISGHNRRRAPDLTRYIRTDQGCHEWLGPRDRKGYGRIQVAGRHYGAHRAMWTQHRGPIPDGLHVDHLCHNRACVNLEHLRLLTPAANNRAKRAPKLTEQQVEQIRRRDGRRVVDIARDLGVSHQYVSDVRAGRRLQPTVVELQKSAIDLYARMARVGHEPVDFLPTLLEGGGRQGGVTDSL